MNKIRLATALSVAGLVLGSSVAAAAPASSSRDAVAQAECDRVTGLSYLLDAFQTGSQAGPGVVYGVVATAVSASFPPGPLAEAQSQVLAAGAQGVEQISIQGPAGIAELKKATAFLAAFNEYANSLPKSGSDGLIALADTGGATIAPFDLTLRQIAGITASVQETCA